VKREKGAEEDLSASLKSVKSVKSSMLEVSATSETGRRRTLGSPSVRADTYKEALGSLLTPGGEERGSREPFNTRKKRKRLSGAL